MSARPVVSGCHQYVGRPGSSPIRVPDFEADERGVAYPHLLRRFIRNRVFCHQMNSFFYFQLHPQPADYCGAPADHLINWINSFLDTLVETPSPYFEVDILPGGYIIFKPEDPEVRALLHRFFAGWRHLVWCGCYFCELD